MTVEKQQASIKINPDIQPRLKRVGNENNVVLIIDDFALDTSDVINYACTVDEFKPDSITLYPGVRKHVPEDYYVSALQPIYHKFYDAFGIPKDRRMKPLPSFYSLITKTKDELSFLQKMPHFDTSNPFFFACLHYLNEGEHGGTGLFRHRPTGYESVTPDRADKYFASAQDYYDRNGQPDTDYLVESNEHYELYEEIAYKPNRLVMYPGNLIHSGLVDKSKDIDDNPATGRLTANFFFEF